MISFAFDGLIHLGPIELESETESEFELANLTQTKHGYWLEARYPFWPAFLSDTVFGRELINPQLVPFSLGASLDAEP